MSSDVSLPLEYLDFLVLGRIKIYLEELVTTEFDILSEDDVVAAAHHAENIYLENTNWTYDECSKRALNFSMQKGIDIYRRMSS